MSLAPGFLLATPKLSGSYFGETVILLLSHDDDGAFGLVLNHETDAIGPQSILQLLDIEEPLIMPGLLSGGPVQPERAFLLHGPGLTGEETMEAGDGLMVSSRRETLAELCQAAEQPFWIVLGYAGWHGGQLESEIEEGAWLATSLCARGKWALDGPREQLWQDLATSMGLEDWDGLSLFTSSAGLQ